MVHAFALRVVAFMIIGSSSAEQDTFPPSCAFSAAFCAVTVMSHSDATRPRKFHVTRHEPPAPCIPASFTQPHGAGSQRAYILRVRLAITAQQCVAPL